MQIDQNRSEVDRIKKLYIELCKTKEQLLHTYQIEKEEWQQQKNDLENRVTELQSRLDNFTVRVGKETERGIFQLYNNYLLIVSVVGICCI